MVRKMRLRSIVSTRMIHADCDVFAETNWMGGNPYYFYNTNIFHWAQRAYVLIEHIHLSWINNFNNNMLNVFASQPEWNGGHLVEIIQFT